MEKLLKMCKLKSYSYVCDIGTGTGTVAYAIAKYCTKVEAIDISPDMLAMAEKKHTLDNINYQIMNAEKASFKDNTFNCVTSRMCFHHIEKQNKAIKECYRIIKPGGKFVISEGIPPQGARKFYDDMFKLKEKRRTYTIDDLVDLLEYGGFTDIEFMVHKMEQVSINNWLENSGLPKKTCKKIYDIHLDSPDYIKKVYNMKILGGDIYMDWLFAIVSGIK
jgi:ubiquinone/menaquinone biosynthesis C-methylase UbiE